MAVLVAIIMRYWNRFLGRPLIVVDTLGCVRSKEDRHCFPFDFSSRISHAITINAVFTQHMLRVVPYPPPRLRRKTMFHEHFYSVSSDAKCSAEFQVHLLQFTINYFHSLSSSRLSAPPHSLIIPIQKPVWCLKHIV